MKRNNNVRQLTSKNVIIMGQMGDMVTPAMISDQETEINAMLMVIHVNKSPIKIVNMSMFPERCLTDSVTMSKFLYDPRYLTKNAVMLMCPIAIKFLRKNATQVLTNQEGGMAAAIVPVLMDPAM